MRRQPVPSSRSGPAPRRVAASERVPRLVLRFGVTTALCLGLAAAAILLVTRHLNTVEAQRSFAQQARVLTHAVLAGQLRAADLARPVPPARRRSLDALFERRLLEHGVLLVAVARPDGLVTYATDHRLIGRRLAAAGRVSEALADTITTDVTTAVEPRSRERVKALRSYVPIRTAGGRTGVALIVEDYRSVDALVDRLTIAVAVVLELVLLVLLAVLVPVLARTSRRLRRQVRQIELHAYQDALTGLPNRLRLAQLVEEAAARPDGGPAAVLLFDLDAFREINDTLGHASGDLLLRELAGRLRARLDDESVLARLGADTFGVLVPDCDEVDARATARLIEEVVAGVTEIGSLPLALYASVGVALFPDHGTDAETLLRRADVARHEAKQARSGVAVYEPERDTHDAARLALVGELRQAVEEGELRLVYQPQLELATGRIVGLEALVRWPHPTRGLLPPSEFVPLAVKTGLIRGLTRHVLATALAQCAEWRAAGSDVRVAVNLTMTDLLDRELPRTVARLLGETKLKPQALELEITETTVMADPARAREVLGRLKAMGVRVAIDDFGTGYSSFDHVTTLPVDALKIDKSFVLAMTRSDRDRTVVRCVLDLARNLAIETVAEGVETEDALLMLRAHGCQLVQGFLIGRPLPAREVGPLLDRLDRAGRNGNGGPPRTPVGSGTADAPALR